MSARLRQTFKYPAEDNEDDAPEELDEEEQETLISNLQSQDASMNDVYVRIFTLLPLCCIPAFVYYLLSSQSIATVRMLCLLGITSLTASAFTMWFAPYSIPVFEQNAASSSHGRRKHQVRVRKLPGLDVELDDDGPLAKSIPYLNGGICAILLLSSLALRKRSDSPDGFWLFVLLPGIINVMGHIARQSIGEVERGLQGLSGLRYDYKGA